MGIKQHNPNDIHHLSGGAINQGFIHLIIHYKFQERESTFIFFSQSFGEFCWERNVIYYSFQEIQEKYVEAGNVEAYILYGEIS